MQLVLWQRGFKMNQGIYFSSDWHIGHEAVIRYSNRPFTGCEHMHRVLVNNYNSTVGKNDLCYFLGDIGLTSGDTVKNVIQQLHGTKILIVGNHDKKGRQFWHSCGFAAVMNGAMLMINKEKVTLSHCPIYGVYREDTSGMRGVVDQSNWHGEEKNYKKGFSLPDIGQFHLHGHVHSPNGGKSKKILGKQYDVGVDANNYRPVSISVIESWIAKYKQGEK